VKSLDRIRNAQFEVRDEFEAPRVPLAACPPVHEQGDLQRRSTLAGEPPVAPDPKSAGSGERRGSVLLIVLVVVVLLALGAYSFSELMVTENEATVMYGRGVQSRAFADSGVEMVAALLSNRLVASQTNIFDNPELFQGVLMREGDTPRGMGRFSIVAPLDADPSSQSVRFGLIDESSKLNLNALVKLDLDDDEMREILMGLPGMTYEIADSILDWIDDDDEPRQFGAEADYYLTLDPPYAPANGPLKSLDELLLVAGVTPWLLFGEDANRNGLLDPNENDGDASPPWDNADGYLDRGWSAFLTVHSREVNLQLDGTPRIDLNNNTLSDLYDELEQVYGEEVAQFVIAYRMYGPYDPEVEYPESPGGQPGGGGAGGVAANNIGGGAGRGAGTGNTGGGGGARAGGATAGTGEGSGGANSGGGQTGGTGGGSGGGQAGGAGRNAPAQGGGNNATEGLRSLVQNITRAAVGNESPVTRGDLNLVNPGPQFTIESLYDLIGVEVRAQTSDGAPLPLDSPWQVDPGEMAQYLPDIADRLTTSRDQFLEGRVNINQARPEVLVGLPGMTPELVEAIIAAQSSMGIAFSGPAAERSTAGWLLIEGLVDLDQMRELDRFITARGDTYRVQVVGHFDAGGPATRLEAIIDAAESPAKVVFLRDLTELGRGYSPSHLNFGLVEP
jgi:hypothetical protein